LIFARITLKFFGKARGRLPGSNDSIFRGKSSVCPSCGARFTGSKEDYEEFDEEEDELEAWDEEDGL